MSHWLGAREGGGNCRQQQDSFSILGNAGSRQQRAPILHHLRHRWVVASVSPCGSTALSVSTGSGAVHNAAEQSVVHVPVQVSCDHGQLRHVHGPRCCSPCMTMPLRSHSCLWWLPHQRLWQGLVANWQRRRIGSGLHLRRHHRRL